MDAAFSGRPSRTQKRMLAQFVQVERLPEEPLDVFLRHRARKVAQVARVEGDWGRQHARRVLAFAEHMSRPRNASSLASILFKWHDAAWLQAKRHEGAGGSNRPGVRLFSGHVQRCWDEALLDARLHL